MTRITKDLTSKIVKAAVAKAGVPAREEQLATRKLELFEALRVETLGGKEKAAAYDAVNAQAKKVFKGLPEGLREHHNICRTSSRLYLNLAGLSVEYRFKDLRVMSGSRVAVLAENPLVQQFHDLSAAERELKEERTARETQVNAVVSSYTTVAKLVAAWPESAELVPAAPPPVKQNLPATLVSSLNASIGLPGGAK